MKKIFFLPIFLVLVSAAAFADESTDPAVSAKLDKIIGNQEKILEKLDSISSELNIVKIRSTR